MKLFLDKDDLERLYDFEEESMEGLVREREAKQNQTTDERVRLISDRLDVLISKIDDPHRLDSNLVLGTIESRLNMLEKAIEQSCQRPTKQSSTERPVSSTLSDATTFMTNDGKWTSSPVSSTDSTSSDDQNFVSDFDHKESDPISVPIVNPNIPVNDAINNSGKTFQKRSSKRKLSRLSLDANVLANQRDEPIATSSFNKVKKVIRKST